MALPGQCLVYQFAAFLEHLFVEQEKNQGKVFTLIFQQFSELGLFSYCGLSQLYASVFHVARAWKLLLQMCFLYD